MDILRDFSFDIDSYAVAAKMNGGKSEGHTDELAAIIDSELGHCTELFEPLAAVEKFRISSVKEGRVELENGAVFTGADVAQALAACNEVSVDICTLGPGIDDYIKERFDSGEYLAGFAADCIAVEALDIISKKLWDKLTLGLVGTDRGITARLAPGDGGWPLEEQRQVFDCLKFDHGVVLLDSGMLQPLKSFTSVYGFGKGIGVVPFGHSCATCTRKKCSYRKGGDCEVTVRRGWKKTVVKARCGESLYQVLLKNSLIDPAPCAGGGTCGKCAARFLSPAPEPTPSDLRHLSKERLSQGERLSCRVILSGPVEISVGTSGDYEILTGDLGRPVKIDPPVKKRLVTVPQNDRPYLERIAGALGGGLTAELSQLRALGRDFEAGEHTAATFGDRLLDLEPLDTRSDCFGLAVDIGTTTVVCYLLDLTVGRVVDVEAAANTQSDCGADVIARIGFAVTRNGTETLRELIVSQLNSMAERLCARRGVDPRHVYNTTVVGNTAMLHFLLGLSTRGLASSPFSPVTTAALDLDAAELGLAVGGVVSILPGIAGFAGADLTAGILESGMADGGEENDGYSLLLDLGTNGEMALGNRHRLFATSVAAGPAFEGGNLSCGVGGVAGAVCRVSLEDGKVEYETIGGKKPTGLCGSGALDLMRVLLKSGLVDSTGRMLPPGGELAERLKGEGAERRFVLEKEPLIAFTQKDVREMQLAKAAFPAGIKVLLKEAGLAISDISRVFIAGGFGSFMDVESAFTIGLLPRELRGRTIFIGNAAGAGARRYLLSAQCRKKAAEIAAAARYIELSGRADFQDYFVEGMTF